METRLLVTTDFLSWMLQRGTTQGMKSCVPSFFYLYRNQSTVIVCGKKENITFIKMLLKHRVETRLAAATDISSSQTTPHVISNTVYNDPNWAFSERTWQRPPRHLGFHECKHRLYMYTKKDDREALRSSTFLPPPTQRCQLQELLQWLQITEILHDTKRDEASIRKSVFPRRAAKCLNLAGTGFT